MLGSLFKQGRRETLNSILIVGPGAGEVLRLLRKRAHAAVIAGALLWAASANAEDLGERYEFRIERGTLGQVLEAFVELTDAQLIYPQRMADATGLNPVVGQYTVEEALNVLLEGTEFSGGLTKGGMIVISLEKAERPTDREDQMASGKLKKGLLASVAAFMFGAGAQAQDEQVVEINDEADDSNEEEKRDVIVVTGTNIRGVKDQFSPVTSIGRIDIDLAGFRDVGDYLDRLPQNFGGGLTPDSTTVGSTSGVGASSVNLRGLGNGATLILLNGRRLSPAGAFGNFVDLSAIPTSAIDRVEVVTDGASAIYGSDAVAGVVNIILRDDYEGAETRLGLSTITDGGGNGIRIGQTVGFSSDRAHGLVTYEYASEQELDALNKDFASAAVEPTDLLPFTQKNSVFAAAGYELADNIKLSADGHYNSRKAKQNGSQDAIFLLQQFQQVEIEQYGGSLNANIALGGDWQADITGAYSKAKQDAFDIDFTGVVGGGELDALTSDIFSIDASIGGPLISITDEPVRAIIGGHFRQESVDLLIASRLDPTSVSIDIENDRDVYAVFGEIYAPIITESDGIPGINRLAITAAARYEDYSDVGSSFDPKVGAVWSPFEGLNIRGTYGTSFRASPLSDLIDDYSAVLGLLLDPAVPSGESIALNLAGSSSDIDPEQSTSWTAGFDYEPNWLDGFRFRATYFNIDYDDRVARASIRFAPGFLYTDFDLDPVRVTAPSALVQELVDGANQFFRFADFFPGFPTDTADVTVILDQRPQNTLASNVSGLDIEANYDLSSDIGNWSFSLAATYLSTFEQQFSTLTPVIDLLDTFGNPVDLRVRGGVQWRTEPVTASVFVNYVDDYVDDAVPGDPFRIDSWTSVDASLRLNIGEILDNRFADDTLLTISALNLFNEDPPQIGAAIGRAAIFDAANSDPAGRRVSLQLTKRW